MHYPAAYPAEIKKSTQLTPPHYPVPEILLVTVKISCYLLRYFEFIEAYWCLQLATPSFRLKALLPQRIDFINNTIFYFGAHF